MDRYVIIIGSMKSGTTTLFDILARHPAIAPCTPKEPGFFAFEDIWKQGYDWYHGLFDFNPDRHRYRLEASTDYTKSPFVTGVWDRMSAVPDKEFRLVYIMRHPLRRIESHARHVQLKRKEIGQQVSERADHGLENGPSPVSFAVSQYAAQLDCYEQAFASGKLFLTSLEDLRADPATVLSDLYAFLGLEPDPHGAEVTRRNAARDKTVMNRNVRRMLENRALTGFAKRLLPKPVRTWIKDRLRHKPKTAGRFTLTAEEEAMLARTLGADLGRLEKVYGFPARSTWGLD